MNEEKIAISLEWAIRTLDRPTAELASHDALEDDAKWRGEIGRVLFALLLCLENYKEVEGDMLQWTRIRGIIQRKISKHNIKDAHEWDDTIRQLWNYFMNKPIL